jgi:hypothetical protein
MTTCLSGVDLIFFELNANQLDKKNRHARLGWSTKFFCREIPRNFAKYLCRILRNNFLFREISYREISLNFCDEIKIFTGKIHFWIFLHFNTTKKIFAKVFAKTFVIFVTFRKLFSRKAKTNFREIFAKIRKQKFSFQPYAQHESFSTHNCSNKGAAWSPVLNDLCCDTRLALHCPN